MEIFINIYIQDMHSLRHPLRNSGPWRCAVLPADSDGEATDGNFRVPAEVHRNFAFPKWVWLKIKEDGVTQVLVHVSTYQGSILVIAGFLSHSQIAPCLFCPPDGVVFSAGFLPTRWFFSCDEELCGYLLSKSFLLVGIKVSNPMAVKKL